MTIPATAAKPNPDVCSMVITANFLDAVALAAQRSPGPLIVPWNAPGNPGGFVSFASFAEWQAFVLSLGLRAGIPDIVTA